MTGWKYCIFVLRVRGNRSRHQSEEKALGRIWLGKIWEGPEHTKPLLYGYNSHITLPVTTATVTEVNIIRLENTNDQTIFNKETQ